MTTEVDRLIALAGKLTEAQRRLVADARLMVSGGVRISWRADQADWKAFANAGIVKDRGGVAGISSYLTPLGLALRNHLLVKDHP